MEKRSVLNQTNPAIGRGLGDTYGQHLGMGPTDYVQRVRSGHHHSPPGAQVRNPNPRWGGNPNMNYGAYRRDFGKGGHVPTLGIPKSGFQVDRSSTGGKTHWEGGRSTRSFSTPSNASSRGSPHNTNTAIKTCTNQRRVAGVPVGVHREDKWGDRNT